MLAKAVTDLLSRVPHFDVGDGRGDVFFRRWKLLKTPWFAVYLHQFFRSDHDRCLHDHPWGFCTLILWGGYWEVVPEAGWELAPDRLGRLRYRDTTLPPFYFDPDGTVGLNPNRRLWRRPGYFGRYPASHAHRIEIEPGTRPWSLVIVGRKRRPWGFWGPSGWVAWSADVPNPVCETK